MRKLSIQDTICKRKAMIGQSMSFTKCYPFSKDLIVMMKHYHKSKKKLVIITYTCTYTYIFFKTVMSLKPYIDYTIV